MTMIPTRDQPPRVVRPATRMGQPAGGGPPGGITPREVLRIIRKRKWLISTLFAVVAGAFFVVTLLWWLYAPFYRASAYLEVNPPPNTIIQTGVPIYGREIIERYKRSLAALVKHQAVWTEALKDRRITSKKWYEKNKEDPQTALDEDIRVSVMPETQYIRLSMEGTDKTELPDIVNAVADSFVEFAARGSLRDREKEIAKLKEQETDLTNRLRSIRNEISSIRGPSAMAAMQARQNLISLALTRLSQEVSEAEIAQSQMAAALQAYKEDQERGTMDKNPQVSEALAFDPTLRQLEMSKIQLETRLENLTRKGFREKHREVETLKNLIDATESKIETRREELTQQVFERIGQERQMGYAITTQQLADLQNRLDRVKNNANDLEEQLGRMDVLAQQAADIQDSLTRIKQAILDRQLLVRGGVGPGEAGDVGPVTIGAYATEPRKPSAPRWRLMMTLGCALGLVLGFGLAFLLELADTSVKSPSDIARKVDLPLLGVVPHSDDLDEEVEDFRRVALLAPQSPGAEAFRQIRTNLLYSGPAQKRRSLLVTSPAPEDGRTTTVVNLAISIAQAGKRVLVVDANFRQPAIADMFPNAPMAGLSSALVGQAKWREVVAETSVPNLFVIASGPLPPNPADLLGSDAMRQLITEMTAEYDQVIFDGSPAMVVSDAGVLSTQVDGVILVVRAGSNNVGMVRKASEQLSHIGAHVIGVVLQGIRMTAGGYLRKNYETFYEYHQKALP